MNAKTSEELKFSLNIPNTLTLSRCLLAIPIALLLYRGTESSILLAGILLVIASLTDWLDGFLARRLGQTSLVGSILDVVADEVLFMPTLIMAIAAGLFSRTDALMPLNPYPLRGAGTCRGSYGADGHRRLSLEAPRSRD